MGEELQKEETLGGDGKKQQRVFRLALRLYWSSGEGGESGLGDYSGSWLDVAASIVNLREGMCEAYKYRDQRWDPFIMGRCTEYRGRNEDAGDIVGERETPSEWSFDLLLPFPIVDCSTG